MTVTVTPSTFSLVDYDADRIRTLAAEVATALGLPPDLPIVVEVDERSPLAHIGLRSVDPPVLAIEGGALEDTRHPRQLSDDDVVAVVGRLLGRVRDRLDPAFGAAPPEGEVGLREADAWDAACMGRLARLGFTVHEPRWRYRFRTRHGFSDAADRVFDRLWSSPSVTWGDLEAACKETAAATGQVAAG